MVKKKVTFELTQQWHKVADDMNNEFVDLFDCKEEHTGPVLSESEIIKYKNMIDSSKLVQNQYKDYITQYEENSTLVYALEKMDRTIKGAECCLEKQIEKRKYFIESHKGINEDFEDLYDVLTRIDSSSYSNKTDIENKIDELEGEISYFKDWWIERNNNDGAFANDPEMIKKINDTIKTIEEYIAKLEKQKLNFN